MKQIKTKSGFTLVECVVAMAVLAIMSLLLMMILNVTINARNNNRQLERELDGQIQSLVADESVTAESVQTEIKFEVSNPGETNYVETIPAPGTNAAGTDNGLDADKIYVTGNEAEVDVIEYDFDDFKLFKDIANGALPGTPATPVHTSKAYGGAKINGNIEITETGKTDITDAGGNVTAHNVTLQISCNVVECSKTAGIKLVLPAGVYNFKKGACTSVTTVTLVSSDTIRIQPASGSDENAAPGNIVAVVSFDISKNDYDRNFKSVGEFYGSGTSSNYASHSYEQPDDLLPIETPVVGTVSTPPEPESPPENP